MGACYADVTGNAVLDLADFANVENVTVLGSQSFTVCGSAIVNTLTGGTGNDSIYGGLGNDLIFAGAGDDTLAGGADDDTVYGGDGGDSLSGDAGNDILAGGGGDDSLTGGIGDDTMTGGAGNDLIVVNATTDVVIERVSSGADTVASADIDLCATDYANVEVLQLTGRDDLWLTGGGTVTQLLGNAGDNSIFGDIADETSVGGDGYDTLVGMSGNDTLFGGADDDEIYGDLGLTTLSGGTGNDVYFVDDASATLVVQDSLGGTTTIPSIYYAPMPGDVVLGPGPSGPATLITVIENAAEGVDAVTEPAWHRLCRCRVAGRGWHGRPESDRRAGHIGTVWQCGRQHADGQCHWHCHGWRWQR